MGIFYSEEDDRLRKSSSDPPRINLDMMMPMLGSVLSSVRNYHKDPDLRKEVGQYLLYKLGKLGIPTAYQVVSPNRFFDRVNIYYQKNCLRDLVLT